VTFGTFTRDPCTSEGYSTNEQDEWFVVESGTERIPIEMPYLETVIEDIDGARAWAKRTCRGTCGTCAEALT